MGIWIEEKHIPPSYFVPSLICFCSIFMFMLKKVMSWGIWGTFENCWVLSFKNSEHRCGTVFCVKQYMYLDGCMYKKLWNNIQCGNFYSRRVKHYWPFILSVTKMKLFSYLFTQRNVHVFEGCEYVKMSLNTCCSHLLTNLDFFVKKFINCWWFCVSWLLSHVLIHVCDTWADIS